MYKRCLVCLLIIVLFISTTSNAKAGSIPSNSDIAAGIVGAAAGIAVIGFVIYKSANHNHTLKGCAASSQDGLQLVNEGDKQTYRLTGDTGLIKPGERMRLSGKKLKTDPSHKQFVVTKVSKNYGACKEMPAPAL